jgi:hypothetical protein
MDADEKYITLQDYHPSGGKDEVYAGNIAHFMLNELDVNRFVNKRVGIANQ